MQAAGDRNPDSMPLIDVRDHPIVFYDGECALCNGFTQWLIARDRRRVFRFTPLQGETAARTIGTPEGEPEQWTIILLDADGEHEHSDAVLRILHRLGGMWRVVCIIRIIPRGLRDWGYRFIARRRLRWFGKATDCRLPTAEERDQLLP